MLYAIINVYMKKQERKILKYINRGLAVFLCAAFTLPLFSCVQKPPTVQNGVIVTPSVILPYSVETNEYAEGVIFDMLERYFQKTVTSNLPEASIQTLKTQAKNIQKITADTLLTEEQYLECIRFLEENSERYVDALARVEKGTSEEEDFDVLKHAYTNLASKMGSGILGAILYELCLYRYDYEYEKAMERFEKYGYAYLKADAEAFAADKATLQEEVGEENFISVMQMACFLSDLFFGGAFEAGQVASFSDHEILALLQEPSFDSVTVSSEGWELLLEYFASFAPTESYAGKLFVKASENGDFAHLSMQMGEMLKLLSAVQDNLTVEQASLLRQNEREKVLSSVFAGFGDAEWSLFETLTATELKKADYETIAGEVYGEAFEAYRKAVTVSSLSELKATAGTDGFSKALEGYLAGISPAFSYGLTL